MFRLSMIVLLLLLAAAALAQVPAGIPYDPKLHPNPIVTWVKEQDFKPTTFSEASKQVGVEIMSLSQEEGRRELLELALPAGGPQKVRIMGNEVEVTFYPVVRQTYALKSGKKFVMYSFRFPRALTSADALNAAAFSKPRRPADARFGTTPPPDEIEIRRLPGLIFDNNDQQLTIYWFELGGGHSVTTDASREELFRVLRDLL